MNELIVGLNEWIIQDGNYGEFKCGERHKLSIEFNGSALTPSDERAIRCKHKSTSSYEVAAKVIFATAEVWVIDFGIKVFCEARPPKFAKVGQWVQGEIDFVNNVRVPSLPNSP